MSESSDKVSAIANRSHYGDAGMIEGGATFETTPARLSELERKGIARAADAPPPPPPVSVAVAMREPVELPQSLAPMPPAEVAKERRLKAEADSPLNKDAGASPLNKDAGAPPANKRGRKPRAAE